MPHENSLRAKVFFLYFYIFFFIKLSQRKFHKIQLCPIKLFVGYVSSSSNWSTYFYPTKILSKYWLGKQYLPDDFLFSLDKTLHNKLCAMNFADEVLSGILLGDETVFCPTKLFRLKKKSFICSVSFTYRICFIYLLPLTVRYISVLCTHQQHYPPKHTR